MNVVVLLGGSSNERAVSLVSGAAVAEALREAGHRVVAFDPVEGVLGAETEARIREEGVGPPPQDSEEGSQAAEVDRLVASDEVRGADVVFPALHGGAGEDGRLQGLLEMLGIPFAGSGSVACALAMDKDLSKRVLRDAGIATPDWVVLPDDLDATVERLGLPLIVKPVSGGSSVHLSICDTVDELRESLHAFPAHEGTPMVEAFVEGREFTVGVVGDAPLPVGEIIPEHRLFDYTCKYEPGMAAEVFPADLPAEPSGRMQGLARSVHALFGMDGFSRVDFMVDAEGAPWCLEANALPGMTPNSLLPKAAAAMGWSFPELCDRIVSLALERGGGNRV